MDVCQAVLRRRVQGIIRKGRNVLGTHKGTRIGTALGSLSLSFRMRLVSQQATIVLNGVHKSMSYIWLCLPSLFSVVFYVVNHGFMEEEWVVRLEAWKKGNWLFSLIFKSNLYNIFYVFVFVCVHVLLQNCGAVCPVHLSDANFQVFVFQNCSSSWEQLKCFVVGNKSILLWQTKGRMSLLCLAIILYSISQNSNRIE